MINPDDIFVKPKLENEQISQIIFDNKEYFGRNFYLDNSSDVQAYTTQN